MCVFTHTAQVLREGGTSLPSDLVLKLHDTSDLLNKLRSHVYKLDKKVNALDGKGCPGSSHPASTGLAAPDLQRRCLTLSVQLLCPGRQA